MDTPVETQKGDMNPQKPQDEQKPLQTETGPTANLENAGQKEQQNRTPVNGTTLAPTQQQVNPQKGPQTH